MSLVCFMRDHIPVINFCPAWISFQSVFEKSESGFLPHRWRDFSGVGAKKRLRAIPGFSWLNFDMNIQVAVLCDAATDDNGKMNLLGAFDTIYAPQMPAIHPQCAVALRATFQPGDEGTRKLSLNFINADGHAILQSIELPVPVTLPDDAHFLTRNFIVNIQQLKFDEPGLYSVDVRLDDESVASVPLLVRQMAGNQSAP